MTDYALDKISNVSFKKGVINRRLTLKGSGFEKSWLVGTGGRDFAAAIRDSGNSRPFPGPSASSASSTQHQSSGAQQTLLELTKEGLKSHLQRMDNYEFEHLVADIWTRMGWETEVSQASVDAGIDVVATKTKPYPEKKVIQAKRYGPSTTVGGPDIQQYASLKHQVPNADSVVIVTTNSFTADAKKRAEELNVKLVDGDSLVDLIYDINAETTVSNYLDLPQQPQQKSQPDQKADVVIDLEAGASANDYAEPSERSQQKTAEIPPQPDVGTRQFSESPAGRDGPAEGHELEPSAPAPIDATKGLPYWFTVAGVFGYVLLILLVIVDSSATMGALVMLFAWIGLPVGMYFDSRSTHQYQSSAVFRWALIGIAVLPLFASLSGSLYLLNRERIEDQTTSRKQTSQNDPSGVNDPATTDTDQKDEDQQSKEEVQGQTEKP